MTKKYHHTLLRSIQKQGFTVRHLKSGHHQVLAPHGALTHVADTPSDPRGLKNFKAWLKRHGWKEQV